MTDQKLENMLNLALDATEAEREKSLQLNVGYDSLESQWEVIVKYSGNLREVLGASHCGVTKWFCNSDCATEPD